MTHFHDQHSHLPDRDPKRGQQWASAFEELAAPSSGFDNPYRMMHGVYMMRCAQNGIRGRLESRLSRFEPEDLEVLRSLGAQYAEGVRAQIGESEGRADLDKYSIRILHPAVLYTDEARCRSLYAEIFDKDLRPVVVSRGCVEHLPRGAAVASLVYSWSDDGWQVGYRPIVSKAAFDELADRASALSLKTLRSNPQSSVLMGLVFENLDTASKFRFDDRSIVEGDVTHFEVHRKEWGVEFRFAVPEGKVIASSRLDHERLEPLTVVYREFS